MQETLTICARCSWIHVDGAGEYCNGCGARHGSGALVAVARADARPSFGADLVPASLLLTLLALLVVAVR